MNLGVLIITYLLLRQYEIDLVNDLLAALDITTLPTGSTLLTALFVTGGSQGVLRIFDSLGIHQLAERRRKRQQILSAVPQS